MPTEAQIVTLFGGILVTTIVFDIILFIWTAYISKLKEKITRLYFALFSIIIFWEMALWIGFFVKTPERINPFLDGVVFSLGALVIFLALYFVWFLSNKKFISKNVIIFFGLAIFALCFLCLTPGAIFQGREYLANNTYNYVMKATSLLFWYYAVLAPLLFLISYIFLRAYKKSRGLEKMRLKYVGFGLMVALVTAMITAIWVPLVYYIFTGAFEIGGATGVVILQTIAAISTSFFSLFSAYAITRYRFMDIKVVLKKSVVYGFSLCVSVLIVSAITYFLYFYTHSFIVFVFILFLVVLFGDHLKQKQKNFLDGIFFLDELDLSKLVSKKVRKLNSIQELEKFVAELQKSLRGVVKAEVKNIFIAEREHNRFRSYYPKNTKKIISFDEDIFPYLLIEGSIIVEDELDLRRGDGVKKIRKFLKTYEASLVGIILGEESKIQALVFIGAKNNNTTFSTEEISNIGEILKSSGDHLSSVIYWHETVEGLKIQFKENAY